jgi:hypothetical protein
LKEKVFYQTLALNNFSLVTAFVDFKKEVGKLEGALKEATKASTNAATAVTNFKMENEAIINVSHGDEKQKLLMDEEANDKNMSAAREETAERLKNILDNSEKIDEALNDIADKDPLVQNDILTQDDRQFDLFTNAIRSSEYFRTLRTKPVERSERAPQQRQPLNDIQNNDELFTPRKQR